jgi:hypothetical protein
MGSTQQPYRHPLGSRPKLPGSRIAEYFVLGQGDPAGIDALDMERSVAVAT